MGWGWVPTQGTGDGYQPKKRPVVPCRAKGRLALTFFPFNFRDMDQLIRFETQLFFSEIIALEVCPFKATLLYIPRDSLT